MNPMNNEQKELLFDYCIGLTSEKETNEAETLISSNQEAAEIHAKLKSAIEPLGSIEPEACPDELAEKVIYRVRNHSDFGQEQLSQLLASEQKKRVTIKIGAWRNYSQKAAVAALVIFSIGIAVPTLRAINDNSRRQRCAMQSNNVFQGLSNYINDYDGPPAVATFAGAPWWKLGDQGRENHSNTRNVYLLPKYDYVDIEDFVCPACKGEVPLKLSDSQIRKLRDFPSRRYVTYSFQINCRKIAGGKLLCRKVIMADMNPLFENLPEDLPRQLRVQLNKTLLTLNSMNHKRRGQNVLFGDGRVEFIKKRFIGIASDDIYTLQDTDVYQGVEVPSRENDFFLAP
jgi:hypothetical protein